MKKLFYMVIMVLLVFGIVACNDDPTVPTEPTEPTDPTVEPTEPTEPTPVLDTVAPLLFGVSDIVINVGDDFDPRAGISAIDNIDGTITANIVVTGTYDVDIAGIYTLTYTITDAAGNVTTQNRQLVVRVQPTSELFITNGDFSEPLDGTWTHWAGEGGASTVAIVNGVLEYDITANGNQWWSSQFSQPNLVVPQGKGFKFSFEAKADTPRAIVVKLENAQYVSYFDQAIMLTTEWQTYEVEFFVNVPTITNGKLIFGGGTNASYLDGDSGNALTKVYLDNISFTEQEGLEDDVPPTINGATARILDQNQAFDPLQGITVSDNMDVDLTLDDLVITGTVDVATPGEYTLTYSLTDASGNNTTVTRTITVLEGLAPSTFVVNNGDFEEDQLEPDPQPADVGWGWHGAASFSVMIKDGVAKIDIHTLGTVPFGVQFYQQNRVIEQGRIYKITFDARADIARPIQVALEEGTSRRFDQIVDLTTEWATYTIYIDHILPGYTNGKFAFFMGLVGSNSVPTTVYLDNVEIERIAEIIDTEAPMLRGIEDYIIRKGINFDPLAGVSIFDNVDKELTLTDIVVDSNLDVDVVGTYTITYTIEDSAENEGVYTRTIHVKEAIDMPENKFVVINGDFSVDQSTPYAQPAVDGWGWHGAGTFTVNIAEGIMTQVVTSVGIVPHGTQFYQQNRVIDTRATYLLTFDAKVDLARSIRLSLEAGTTVNWFEIVDITTEWATYQAYITIPAGGFTNGKFAFFAGLVEPDSPATTFYLDNITLELVGYLVDEDAPMIFGLDEAQTPEGIAFDPLLGVTVFDVVDKGLTPQDIVVTGTVDTNTPGDYLLTYTLTDRSGNDVSYQRNIIVTSADGDLPTTFVLINGDFEVAQAAPAPAGTGWGWHGSGSWNIELVDGAAKIQVFDTWALFFGVQFYTLNRTVTQGHTYLITFRAKADAPRPIQLNLESSGVRFASYFELGTEYQTFTYEYTHETASITNGKFSFFVGDIFGVSHPTTVYIDDVEISRIIEKSADLTPPQIWNVNDTFVKEDTFFNPMAGLKVYDHVDKLLTVDDVIVTGTVDVATPGDYTLTYTLEDASGNLATYTRVVTVLDDASFDFQRVILLDPSFTEELAITNQDSNVGWTLKTSGTGAFNPHTFVDGAIAIEVTNVGTVPHGIQFFQRNSYRVELGQTYLLTFKAKADIARDIRVSFENTTGNFQVMQFNVVPITTEWATYEVIFTNMANSTPDFKVGLFLGLVDNTQPERSVATTVYFDDVTLELVSLFKDDVDPMISAADASVVQNAVFNPMTGVKFGDFAKVPAVMISSATEGLVTMVDGSYVVSTATVGTFTLVYTVTDIYGNETVFNRTLTVTEPVVE